MRSALVRTLPVAALLAVSLAAPVAAAVIHGTSGPDMLVGTAKADTIRGYGGADRIYGKAGADRLFAGYDSKRDRVYGGLGNDRINIWLADTAYAGRGNDVVRLNSGTKWAMTYIYCGPGYDRLYVPGDGSGAAEPDNGSGWLVSYHSCEAVY
jgi:Ca2+-binding RTX toxin-like protein